MSVSVLASGSGTFSHTVNGQTTTLWTVPSGSYGGTHVGPEVFVVVGLYTHSGLFNGGTPDVDLILTIGGVDTVLPLTLVAGGAVGSLGGNGGGIISGDTGSVVSTRFDAGFSFKIRSTAIPDANGTFGIGGGVLLDPQQDPAAISNAIISGLIGSTVFNHTFSEDWAAVVAPNPGILTGAIGEVAGFLAGGAPTLPSWASLADWTDVFSVASSFAGTVGQGFITLAVYNPPGGTLSTPPSPGALSATVSNVTTADGAFGPSEFVDQYPVTSRQRGWGAIVGD